MTTTCSGGEFFESRILPQKHALPTLKITVTDDFFVDLLPLDRMNICLLMAFTDSTLTTLSEKKF